MAGPAGLRLRDPEVIAQVMDILHEERTLPCDRPGVPARTEAPPVVAE